MKGDYFCFYFFRLGEAAVGAGSYRRTDSPPKLASVQALFPCNGFAWRGEWRNPYRDLGTSFELKNGLSGGKV
jgi:hypothetical protein